MTAYESTRGWWALLLVGALAVWGSFPNVNLHLLFGKVGEGPDFVQILLVVLSACGMVGIVLALVMLVLARLSR